MGTYLVLENPYAWLLGARVCAELRHEGKANWDVRWQNHARLVATEMGEKTGTDYSWV
jgi:hypothetical protein